MIITLCGSARFEKEFKDWNLKLSMAGHVVFSLTAYPSDYGGKDWYTPEQKQKLDLIHFAKITASDAILVLNVDNYIGESTSREIAWARLQLKNVFWLERTVHAKLFDPDIEDLFEYEDETAPVASDPA